MTIELDIIIIISNSMDRIELLSAIPYCMGCNREQNLHNYPKNAKSHSHKFRNITYYLKQVYKWTGKAQIFDVHNPSNIIFT